MKRIAMRCWSTILDTMKVLFVYYTGEWCLGYSFLSVGTRMGAITLAMADTQDWWVGRGWVGGWIGGGWVDRGWVGGWIGGGWVGG